MSNVIVFVEWVFIEMKLHWTAVDFKRKLRINVSPVANLRNCMYPNPIVLSRVRGRETSMVQGRDVRLVATDCKRSRRSGAGSDTPEREWNTPNSPRMAGNAQKQQTQALLTPMNNGCQDYMANTNKGWEQPVW